MKEELITLETAKLAKEKGFDEPCTWLYYDPPKIIAKHPKTKQEYSVVLNHCGSRQYNYYQAPPKDNRERYHACNQAVLQKWLREVHKIDIGVEGYAFGYYPFINNVPPSFQGDIKYVDRRWNLNNENDYSMGKSLTYEEALEEGLQQALKLI